MKVKTVIEIMKMLKELVSEGAFKERHKEGEKSFSRKKKLDFETVFFFVLSLVKLGLDFDAEHFLGTQGIEVWPSAITQRRAQIKWTAFEEALEHTALNLPQEHTFKGYRVYAVDGIHGELPRQTELIEKYGLVSNAGYPQFHAVAIYDVMNEFFACASWDKHPTNERESAVELIKTKTFPEESLFVFDRGFPCIELFKCINDRNSKFLMRASSSTFKEIMKFAASGKQEALVKIEYDKKRAKGNKHRTMEIDLPYTCALRCVRVELSGGKSEILVTNLFGEDWTAAQIAELYFLRWGIETTFNHLKNAIHIETFIGIKDNSIRQEFFAGLLKYSLVRQSAFDAQAEYDSKKKLI
jgi:transposase